MRLSKAVPEHRKTVHLTWLKHEFQRMGPKYRAIREKVGKPLDKCWWCDYVFRDGDWIGLAGREKGKNVVLCQTCCAEATAEVNDE